MITTRLTLWRKKLELERPGLIPLTLGYAIVMLFFLVSDVATYVNSHRVALDNRQSSNVFETIRSLDLLDTEILSAESANRTYLLTGDPDSLTSYGTHKNAVNEQVAKAEDLVRTMAIPTTPLDEAELYMGNAFNEMDSLVATRQTYGVDRVSALMTSTGAGIEDIRQAQIQIGQVRVESQNFLDDSLNNAERSEHTSNVAFVFVSIFGYGLLTLVYVLMLRTADGHQRAKEVEKQHRDALEIEVRSRAIAEESVRALNSSLERRVEERTSKLVEAHREMEGFCYSVSHDLRTPLRTIDATSAILLEDFASILPSEARHELQRQARAAKRLDRLIDDLLQFVRLREAPLIVSAVDVSQMAADVAEDVGVNAQIVSGITVQGDPGLIRLLLNNLFENSRKFGREGVKVSVGVEDNAIYVRDDGEGFDMAYSEKLFQPFQRLHGEEIPGTGIGLATVRRIVERHGGRVWAASTPGQGATFYLEFGPNSAKVKTATRASGR